MHRSKLTTTVKRHTPCRRNAKPGVSHELPIEILIHIFHFAAGASPSASANLCRISSWVRDLVQPELYASISLQDAVDVHQLYRCVSRQTSATTGPASMIDSLWIADCLPEDIGSDWYYAVPHIIQHTPRLQRLCIPEDALFALATAHMDLRRRPRFEALRAAFVRCFLRRRVFTHNRRHLDLKRNTGLELVVHTSHQDERAWSFVELYGLLITAGGPKQSFVSTGVTRLILPEQTLADLAERSSFGIAAFPQLTHLALACSAEGRIEVGPALARLKVTELQELEMIVLMWMQLLEDVRMDIETATWMVETFEQHVFLAFGCTDARTIWDYGSEGESLWERAPRQTLEMARICVSFGDHV